MAAARLVADYVSILDDGHASVSSPSLVQAHWGVPGPCLTRADGEIVIEQVADASPREKGLTPGTIVAAVDGAPRDQAVAGIPGFLRRRPGWTSPR